MSYQNAVLSINAVIGRLPDVGAISDKCRTALGDVADVASGLLELAANIDPMISAVAHSMRVDAEKSRLREKTEKARDTLLPAIEAWRAAQNAARLAKADLKPDEFAQELRAVFRTLDDVGRAVYMQNATDAQDGAAAAAILTAPLTLTGITADELERYRDEFLSRIAASPDADADAMRSCVTTALGCALVMATPSASTAGVYPLPASLMENVGRGTAQQKAAEPKAAVEYKHFQEFGSS